MTNITTTLKECHEIVWKFREELSDVWPTPPVEDCLLFSFCELGESIDAYLRTKGEYARNRDKDLSVLDELADCALMLLTALGSGNFDWHCNDVDWSQGEHEWHCYIWDMQQVIAVFFEPFGVPKDAWHENLIVMLDRIATHPGMDLPNRLIARLERIKAKQMRPSVLSALDREIARLEIIRVDAPNITAFDEDALLSQAGSHE